MSFKRTITIFLSFLLISCAEVLHFKKFDNDFLKIDSSNFSRKIIGKHLFFDNEVFLSHGKDLVIEAETIHFNDTQIETFKEGAAAPAGRDGRSGGFLVIRAESITGRLHVVLRGESGGQGVNSRDLEAHEGVGKKGRDGKAANPHCSQVLRECTCSLVRHGKNGKRGKKGLTGQKGFRGGDSGILLIQSQNSSHNFEVSYESFPGRGGKGGLGGLGGLGGEGGKGDRSKHCHAHKGKLGKRGERGSSGSRGESGEKAKVCIETGKARCFLI